jgi:hypothetical protein
MVLPKGKNECLKEDTSQIIRNGQFTFTLSTLVVSLFPLHSVVTLLFAQLDEKCHFYIEEMEYLTTTVLAAVQVFHEQVQTLEFSDWQLGECAFPYLFSGQSNRYLLL